MPLQYIFWTIMLVWALFGGAVYGGYISGERASFGHSLIVFVLFVILGIATFGGPVK